MSTKPLTLRELPAAVAHTIQATPVYDIHTHLYEPVFGDLLLWGIDELLVYHYLISEAFRYSPLSYEEFWGLSKVSQAERVWDLLFVRHSPVSEACRGVLTTLQKLGLDVKKRDLKSLRQWFKKWSPADYVTHCMELAGVDRICMTNSPFDEQERAVWLKGFPRDGRFTSGLRIDPLLMDWPAASRQLASQGYRTQANLNRKSIAETRRFLEDWTRRTQAQYLMVSLPPDFGYPDSSVRSQMLRDVLLPHCRDHGLPFAVMLGVKRAVNPALRLAGDGVGWSQLEALENLCAGHPENRFLSTVLSRENQHTLCVIARKFRNLHPFGCWWFTNVPFVIEEITRLRLELIGLSMTPQHSDARVLDQIIYKWEHFRQIMTGVLIEKYTGLMSTGWTVTQAELKRDVRDLFGQSFTRFCKGNTD
jgi:hypothetical protein